MIRHKIWLFFGFVFFVVTATLLCLFCLNPPVPEALVKEVLEIDHSNRCLKIDI